LRGTFMSASYYSGRWDASVCPCLDATGLTEPEAKDPRPFGGKRAGRVYAAEDGMEPLVASRCRPCDRPGHLVREAANTD